MYNMPSAPLAKGISLLSALRTMNKSFFTKTLGLLTPWTLGSASAKAAFCLVSLLTIVYGELAAAYHRKTVNRPDIV